ncbi:MAG: hypothetical protein Q9227_003256 [Pyrenula ochraceoflavens]
MKSDKAATLACLATGAFAQSPFGSLSTTVTDPNDPGITTSSITVCPSATSGSLTVTAVTTQTYCPGPECTEPEPSGDYTIWSTVYKSVCPTGTVDRVYTITESCPCEASRTEAPGYLPPGFAVTSMTCSVGCGEKPTVIPITAPTAGPSAPGAPAAPAAPAASAPAAPAPGAPASGPPAAAPPAQAGSPAPASGGASPEAPAAGAPEAGAGSRVMPSGGSMGGSNSTMESSPNSPASPPIASFTGAASSINLPVALSVLLGLMIGVFAWLL